MKHSRSAAPASVLLPLLLLAPLSCVGLPDARVLSAAIEERTGHALTVAPELRDFEVPPSVSLADGLAEEEAAALALWNNQQFRADLDRAGIAHADVVEAGLLRNPGFNILFPIGSKALQQTLRLPLESIWQRPWRMSVARRNYERVTDRLVQQGLDMVRDARIAHADAVLARDRARLARETAAARGDLAGIAQARLRAGDVSELEASAARIDGLRARDDAAQGEVDAELALGRLRLVLGMDSADPGFDLAPSGALLPPAPGLAALQKDALASRPEMRAAEMEVDVARRLVRQERSKFMNLLTGIWDSNGRDGHGEGKTESGPGLEIELPLFGRNQGGRVRALAEHQRASHMHAATQQRIEFEVQEARAAYERARQALDVWRARIGPAADAALGSAEKAYSEGEESYLVVLEMTRQLIDTRRRAAEVAAEARRAAARLDQTVGRRVFDGR